MDSYLTTKEVCARLKISPDTLGRMVKARKLTVVRFGKRMNRYRNGDIERLAELVTRRSIVEPPARAGHRI